MAKMQKPKFNLNQIGDYRQQLGLNQQHFWKPFGVTQSAGSRYETGRSIPMSTAMLLVLRDTGTISDEDLQAAAATVKKARGKR